MANALDVDPAKALYLGRDANEQNVETMDLSHYRIVAFATHGLVPGDLDGLTQPALALTAPDVAGVKGDGLLTMEKILALKLDADWVVLSACNTAAGAGAGAEAASGLGSAFFYAGTRALAGHQLVGAFGFGARVDHAICSGARAPTRPVARRSVAASDDGAARRAGRGRRLRPYDLHLCASAVLGSLLGDRRWRRELIGRFRSAASERGDGGGARLVAGWADAACWRSPRRSRSSFARRRRQRADFELVTPDEAALPTGAMPSLDLRGSPTRRPM